MLTHNRQILRPIAILWLALTVLGSAKVAYAQKDLHQRMQELKIITEEYPPLSFTNNKGKIDGLATDVVREIMRRLGINQRIFVWPWARGYRSAKYGPNYVLFSVSYTDTRAPLFHWVGSIYKLNSNLYAKLGSGITINSLQDAKKIPSIGSYRDSMDEQILEEQGLENLHIVTNNVQNIRKLMAGHVDVIAATDLTLPSMVKKAGYEMNDLEKLYTFATTEGYIVFSKQVSSDVVDAWQSALEDMKEEGVLQQIQQKWIADIRP